MSQLYKKFQNNKNISDFEKYLSILNIPYSVKYDRDYSVDYMVVSIDDDSDIFLYSPLCKIHYHRDSGLVKNGVNYMDIEYFYENSLRKYIPIFLTRNIKRMLSKKCKDISKISNYLMSCNHDILEIDNKKLVSNWYHFTVKDNGNISFNFSSNIVEEDLYKYSFLKIKQWENFL